MNLKKMLLGKSKDTRINDSVSVVREAVRADFRTKLEALECEARRVFGENSRKREEPNDG